MLHELNLQDQDELHRMIPNKYRINKSPLNLPEAWTEYELKKFMRQKELKNMNCVDGAICFLGAGVYDHEIPSVVDHIVAKGEFLTGYTPYQPEMSQGALAALGDFTEKIAALTGLPCVTSSHYDGATALAESCYMCTSYNPKRSIILVSAGLFPHWRSVLDTYCWGRSITLQTIDVDKITGKIDLGKLQAYTGDWEHAAALIFQSPNCFGVTEDVEFLRKLTNQRDTLLVGVTHPFLVSGPRLSEQDGVRDAFMGVGYKVCDIVVMEGQPLGMHMFGGGAHLGILACAQKLRKYAPGRLIGRVLDIDGNPAYALVEEAREQHVARQNATSNICSNQALCAIRTGVFLTLHGGLGLKLLAHQSHLRATALKNALAKIPGIRIPYMTEHFNEFLLELPTPDHVKKALSLGVEERLFVGVSSRHLTCLKATQLLVAVTETKSAADLEKYVRHFALVMDVQQSSLITSAVSEIAVELERGADQIQKYTHGANFVRGDTEATNGRFNSARFEHGFGMPRVLLPLSEVECVRKYTKLASSMHGVDTGPYLLGSCTMKYNPKRNDAAAMTVGFQALHPFQPVSTMNGLAEVYAELKVHLCELTGMDVFDLTPAAGAHGELKGIMMARKYFEDRGEGNERTEIIVLDSAHGTNLATSTMAGFECRIVGTELNGQMDLKQLSNVLSDGRAAVLMMTNPSTFGLFDTGIQDIVKMTHDAGALLYYDGANMNALMGHARPGDLGFDIVHLNTHKTLSTPHGSGGPGAGPVGVKSFLAKYICQGLLPDNDGNGEACNINPGSSLPLKLYSGHISVLLRAFSYIRSLGAVGLKQATSDAVLNATYLSHRLSLKGLIQPVFKDQPCMHEFLADWKNMTVSGFDLCKRLVDYGIHPPTLVGAGCVYYGEDLKEAILFEPTESESKASLDRIVDAIEKIAQEAKENPGLVLTAPHSTLSRRLTGCVVTGDQDS